MRLVRWFDGSLMQSVGVLECCSSQAQHWQFRQNFSSLSQDSWLTRFVYKQQAVPISLHSPEVLLYSSLCQQILRFKVWILVQLMKNREKYLTLLVFKILRIFLKLINSESILLKHKISSKVMQSLHWNAAGEKVSFKSARLVIMRRTYW